MTKKRPDLPDYAAVTGCQKCGGNYSIAQGCNCIDPNDFSLPDSVMEELKETSDKLNAMYAKSNIGPIVFEQGKVWTDEEREKIAQSLQKFVDSQKDMEPELRAILDKHFWEILA
jgi:hypothetical protein